MEEKGSIDKLLEEFADDFHIPGEILGSTDVLQHRIPTTDNTPICTRQYRFPPVHKEEINRQVNELLEGEIIRNSQSPYNTPIWIVPKKPDSQGNKRWRLVLDFRALNEKTIGDSYPLPNITDILDQLGGAKYFSTFDLASGFHQIKMSTEDRHKTAFSTPYGHYEFDRMPFGLKNAPATFQRLMDLVLTGLQGIELFVYLDDIVIYAGSLDEHELKFRRLMGRLRSANLKLQPDKCEFLRKEVGYLGHVIGEDGVRPDPGKIEAVKNFPIPRNVKNIRQFLGLAGYYRRFINGFSKIAKPLTNLLKKETPTNGRMNTEQLLIRFAINYAKHLYYNTLTFLNLSC
jgi:Reverse transcriptase (RNA-dependent DNA polymerase).